MNERRRWWRHRDGESGQTLIEFMVVAPLLFLLLFGIIEFAVFLQSWVTVQHAAQEGARYAATGRTDCDGISDDREACIVQEAKKGTTGMVHGGIDGSDVFVEFVSWSYPDYADPATEDSAGSPCDAIEVRVSTTHEFIFPPLSVFAPSGIPLTGRHRMLIEPYGQCGA